MTKGGFYQSRRALLDAILETWSHGRIVAINRQTTLVDASPRERLKSLVKLYSEPVNAQGMAIELAIRQWARSDDAAATAVARVDAQRLKNVEELYTKMGLTPEHAKARSVLFYAFIFGQSLLVLDQAPRRRASLMALCADLLVEFESSVMWSEPKAKTAEKAAAAASLEDLRIRPALRHVRLNRCLRDPVSPNDKVALTRPPTAALARAVQYCDTFLIIGDLL